MEISSQNISFNGGLRRIVEKKLYNNEAIEKIIQAYPRNKGVVGSGIPFDWFDPIDNKKQQRSFAKKLFAVFAEHVLNLRKYAYKTVKSVAKGTCYSSETKAEEACNVMAEALKKAGLNVQSLEYIDSGAYGDVYCLTVKTNQDKIKQYGLKVFNQEKSESLCNGNCFEPNIVEVLDARNLNSKIGLKNFCFSDIKSAYMISDFVDYPYPSIRTNINPLEAGINLTNRSSENLKYGYLIDPGGIVIVDELLNPVAQGINRKIKSLKKGERLDYWKSILNQENLTPDIARGLTLSLINIPLKDQNTARVLLGQRARRAPDEIKNAINKVFNYESFQLPNFHKRTEVVGS